MTNCEQPRKILGENLPAACDPFAWGVRVTALRGQGAHAAMFGNGRPLAAKEMSAALSDVRRIAVVELADKGDLTSPTARGSIGMRGGHAVRHNPGSKPTANALSMEVR
ncbi:MAG: hypothetical protein IPI58_07070 [Alphaproteobacteria bacterium]|nr:MAG: hypothetical protein IPI58_07070 [Alphaproteobacteria bacterium]